MGETNKVILGGIPGLEREPGKKGSDISEENELGMPGTRGVELMKESNYRQGDEEILLNMPPDGVQIGEEMEGVDDGAKRPSV